MSAEVEKRRTSFVFVFFAVERTFEICCNGCIVIKQWASVWHMFLSILCVCSHMKLFVIHYLQTSRIVRVFIVISYVVYEKAHPRIVWPQIADRAVFTLRRYSGSGYCPSVRFRKYNSDEIVILRLKKIWFSLWFLSCLLPALSTRMNDSITEVRLYRNRIIKL